MWLSRAIFCTSLIIILLYFKPQNRSPLIRVWELDLVRLNLASKQVPSLRQQNVLSLQSQLLGPVPADLFPNDPASLRLWSTSVGEPRVEGRKFRREEFLEQQEEGGMTGKGDWYFPEEPMTNSARITVVCHGYRFPYLGALSGGACRRFCLAPCSALSRLQIQSGLNKFQCSLSELPRTPPHSAVGQPGDITANSRVGASCVTFPTEEPLAKSLSFYTVFLGTNGLILARLPQTPSWNRLWLSPALCMFLRV